MKRFFLFLLIISARLEIEGQTLTQQLLCDFASMDTMRFSEYFSNYFSATAGPPSKVAGLSGYHGTVPLGWSPVVSDSLVGYDIYKSTSSGGGFNKIGHTIINPYFRDGDVINGIRYYYMIKSVYRHSESDFSITINGLPVENGYILRPAWASTAPTIDGVIKTGEWPQNKAIDISFPTQTGSVLLYAMNNQNTLFLAIDDKKNTKLDDWDAFGMYFDRDLDREWSSDIGAEGLLQFHWDASTSSIKSRFLALHVKWPNPYLKEDDVVLPGMKSGISFTNGHVQFEMSISLNEGPLRYRPFSSFGYLIYSFDSMTNYFTGFLPQQVEAELPKFAGGIDWSLAPFAFGDLILAQSAPSSFWADVDKDQDVDIFDIQLVAGCWGNKLQDAYFKAEYDVNSDGRIDIFDIQLIAAWWNKPIPTVKLLKDFALAAAEPIRIKIHQKNDKVYELCVTDAIDLAAFQLEFSAREADLQQMVLGDFLSKTGNTVMALPPSHSPNNNTVTVGAFSFGVNAGASGEGKLADLIFDKNTTIKVKDFQCADLQGNALTVVMEKGDQLFPESGSSQFTLLPNYPNPFNPITNISFSLPTSEVVNLKVFDLSGHQVARMNLGIMSPGWHQVPFSGDGLPSGKYFYRLQAGPYSGVKSMVILH